MTNDRRSPTWKYLATTLVGLIITITTILYADTRNDIKSLQDDKLDKTEYYKDYRQAQERFKKIDDIYEILIADQKILRRHREVTEGITP
jgi:hypothetical protein